MRLRAVASCSALPILVAAALLAGAAPVGAATPERVNAPNAPGAVHLPKGGLKRIGKTILCGRVHGRWQAGTRRLSYWFFTHTQRARNLTSAARHHHGA